MSSNLLIFTGEHSVDVPLWLNGSLLFNNADDAVSRLGISQQLANDIAHWGRSWQTDADEEWLDAEAVRLVRRLQTELREIAEQTGSDNYYRVVYWPG